MSVERLETAAALRRAFDLSFAQAREADGEAMESLLAIRVSGDPYAVRLSDIASLHADRKVVPLPSPASELLGLVSFRGTMAPVYDLRTLLGHEDGPARPAPRWLLLVRTPDVVGLAFDLFEAHIRATARNISSTEDGGSASEYVRGVVRTADGVRPLIHTASLIEAITRRSRSDRPPKEH